MFSVKMSPRENMKKSIIFLLLLSICYLGEAGAAIEIKKAPSASEQKQQGGGLMAGNSLIPTALGLVGNVMALNKQQAALAAECEPTDTEITFVKTLVQEWAKAGGTITLSGRRACKMTDGKDYAFDVLYSSEGVSPCYNVFNLTTDNWQIYKDYPYPGKGHSKKDESLEDSDKNSIPRSDIYEIFPKIGFEDADYLPSEVSQVARLKEKAIKCAPDKLSAKQRELWGNMLTQTVGGLGQKQNAGTTMQQVGSVLQSGGNSPLGTLGGTVSVLTGSLLNQ
jgi:hypothetical protein